MSYSALSGVPANFGVPAHDEPPLLLSPAEPAPLAAPRVNIAVRSVRLFFSGVEWLFGVASLIVMLAVLATIPLLNLLSLGYLLTVSGRVAKSGRLRDGFVGVRKAAVLGRIGFFTLLFFLPLRFLASLRDSAWLIDPDGRTAHRWQLALVTLTTLIVWHIVWAVIRGGRVRHFLWPAPLRFYRWLRTPNKYSTLRDTSCDFVIGLHLPGYFSLGLRGFVGTFIWLLGPVGVLVIASKAAPGPAGLLSLIGGIALGVVALYLPFMQTHFAAENRFAALFEVKRVRRFFAAAPVAFWFALPILLLFALPLYLLKIELVPREVAWLPGVLFVVSLFPARLLCGWAMGRARRRMIPRHFIFRWLARLGSLPVVFFYVLIVYLSQYLAWYGALGLLDQHAFLVPSPIN